MVETLLVEYEKHFRARKRGATTPEFLPAGAWQKHPWLKSQGRRGRTASAHLLSSGL
jgi:hypothetical protein